MNRFNKIVSEANTKEEVLPDGTIVIENGIDIKYLKNGVLHRIDGPAVVNKRTGTSIWYNNGELHRVDGPAYIGARGMYKEWWLDGHPHREDGPAIYDEKNRRKEWYLHGKLHRIDGPARMNSEGMEEYYVNGKFFKKEEFEKHFGE